MELVSNFEFCFQCKWSRKGFLRTRWNLNGTIFDLVNIHLFHDASNFVAMETVKMLIFRLDFCSFRITIDQFTMYRL